MSQTGVPVFDPSRTGYARSGDRAARPAASWTDAAAAKADELGVDVRTVKGTGADGRITVADVETAAK